MAPDGITSRHDFTDQDLFSSQALHEGGHMSGALAFGYTPEFMAVARDRTSQIGGGTSSTFGPTDAQYIAVVSKLGTAAEERAYNEMGYTERSHPELFHDIRAVGGSGDDEQLAKLQRENPHVVIDQERAMNDARRMVANPTFWAMVSALGREVDRHGYLDGNQIRAIAAPFNPATLLHRENILPRVPGKEQVSRAREAAGLAEGQAPPPPKERGLDPVGDLVSELGRRAKAAAGGQASTSDSGQAAPQGGPPGLKSALRARARGPVVAQARALRDRLRQLSPGGRRAGQS